MARVTKARCSHAIWRIRAMGAGITDGFDRFSEPVEDIRITMQREELAARLAEEQRRDYLQ